MAAARCLFHTEITVCTAGEQGTALKVPERRRDLAMSEAEHRKHWFRDWLLQTNVGSGGFVFFCLRQAKSFLQKQEKGGEIIMDGDIKAGLQNNIPFIKHNV